MPRGSHRSSHLPRQNVVRIVIQIQEPDKDRKEAWRPVGAFGGLGYTAEQGQTSPKIGLTSAEEGGEEAVHICDQRTSETAEKQPTSLGIAKTALT